MFIDGYEMIVLGENNTPPTAEREPGQTGLV